MIWVASLIWGSQSRFCIVPLLPARSIFHPPSRCWCCSVPRQDNGMPPSHRKRMRTTWLLGACVVSSLQGGAAFALLPSQKDLLRHQATPAERPWFGVAGRREVSMSMKTKKSRKAAGVRARRTGPRTDVEGYSHANFREFFATIFCFCASFGIGEPCREVVTSMLRINCCLYVTVHVQCSERGSGRFIFASSSYFNHASERTPRGFPFPTRGFEIFSKLRPGF